MTQVLRALCNRLVKKAAVNGGLALPILLIASAIIGSIGLGLWPVPVRASSSGDLTWATRASMPTARNALGVAAASNGKIYAVGGCCSGQAQSAVEEYDPATDTWATRASMPTPRYYLRVTAANNGRIYAIGGQNSSGTLATVEEYDPATNTWATRASMPTARRNLGVVTASNGKIYAIGGTINTPRGEQPLSTVEEYDPATNTWATRASMPTGRFALGVAAASNGKIYAIGGHIGYLGGNVSMVEEYDLATDTWTTRASMQSPRHELAAVGGSDGKVYAIGGFNCGALSLVEEYDPATDTWTTRASMPTARTELAVTGIQSGKIYAIGGNSSSCNQFGEILSTNEEATITINNPVPSLTSLDPSSATAGGVAFNLTINGTNFVTSSVVHWNGTSRPTTYVSATQLTAAIATADIATAGVVNVTVANPTPSGGTSNALPFTVKPANQPPSVDAGGPYTVKEGGSVTVTATGNDPEGGPLTYEWDLDNDGTFETPGQSVPFLAGSRDGPSGPITITVRATDNGGLPATDDATVTIENKEPTATFANASGQINEGQSATLAFSNQSDPSAADGQVGFRYSYDCTNDGTFEVVDSTAASHACLYSDNRPGDAPHTARGRIADKDGGFADYTAQVTVNNVAPANVTAATSPTMLNENGSTTLSGSFTDPGAQDAHTVVIDWGDGSANTVLGLEAGILSFSASHQYLDDNPSGTASDSYAITVTITDDADIGSGGASVTVNNTAPIIIETIKNSANPTSVTVAYSDAGVQDTHSCTINWGDGSSTTVTGSGDVCSASHTYSSSGSYTVQATVTDDDGGSVSTGFQWTVTGGGPGGNPPPGLGGPNPGKGPPGGSGPPGQRNRP